MRLLLTGYSGFVGRNFLQTLNEDDEVVCIGRSEGEFGPNVTVVKTDLSNTESVKAAALQIQGKFDAIVHLAAYVPRKHDEDLLVAANKVNVEGTINLLEAFSGRFDKLVIGSTAEVYDQSKIRQIIDEEDPVNAGSYYGATKLASEYIARTYGAKNSVPTIVLRFSVMYGDSDPIARALPNFIKTALANEAITVRGGDSLRDYVHIDDVSRSIHCAITSNASGVFNIGTGRGVSIESAAKAIVDCAKSKSVVDVESADGGVDIVLSIKNAQDALRYEPTIFFPDKLDAMENTEATAIGIVAGDAQFDTSYLQAMLDDFIDKSADYVKASRFFHREAFKKMPRYRQFGNIFISLLTKFSTGYYSVTDITNGCGFLRRSIIEKVNFSIVERRYDYETSMLTALSIADAKVIDHAVPAIYGEETSTINLVPTALRNLRAIWVGFWRRIYYKYVLFGFHPIALFLFSGVIVFGLGFIMGLYILLDKIITSASPTTGSVMLCVLPLILGFQLILTAFTMDVSNEKHQ